MSQTFIKHQEDFVCEHCGQAVAGTGYTNHCPVCLWSKHVDVHPGDRACRCGGLMPPVGYAVTGGGFDLIHKCQDCAMVKKNKTATGDDLSLLAGL